MSTPNIEFDDRGRITKVSIPAEIYKGHSVCNDCGKDMPVCWHIICTICNKTFCYDCAKSDVKFWYCKECYNG